MRYKKAKGEITVFLTMLFSILSALIVTVVESARAQAIRVETERVMQTGIHSCFGEYNQDLLGYYRILAIDTSYRGGRGSVEDLRQHLARYAQENFKSSDLSKQADDWLQITMEEMAVRNYQLLSDETGAVFTDQAVREIRERGYVSNRSSVVRAKNHMQNVDDGPFMSAFAQAVSSAGNEDRNPAAEVFDMAVNMDLLQTVLQDAAPSSRMDSDCASRRRLNSGTVNGRFSLEGDDGFLFDSYAKIYFGTYTAPLDHAVFTAEQEYLIAGLSSEADSLLECARRILAQREEKNLEGLRNDADALEQTEELAMEICELAQGNLYDTQMSLLYAWAYAESVVEVSRLLHGGCVSMDDCANPRTVPLRECTDFPSYCASSGGSGEPYGDYLAGLMANVDQKTKAMRCLDLIELNLRHAGHPGFCADACVTYFQAKMTVESDYGYGCTIEREYGYFYPK